MFRLAVVHFKTMETLVLSNIEVKSMDPDNRLLFVAPHGGSLAWCVPHLLWAQPVGDIHYIPRAGWCQVLCSHWTRVSEPPSMSTDRSLICEMKESSVAISSFDIAFLFCFFFFAKKSHNCYKKKKAKQCQKKNKIFCSPETTAKNNLVNLLSHSSLCGLCPPQSPWVMNEW